MKISIGQVPSPLMLADFFFHFLTRVKALYIRHSGFCCYFHFIFIFSFSIFIQLPSPMPSHHFYYVLNSAFTSG